MSSRVLGLIIMLGCSACFPSMAQQRLAEMNDAVTQSDENPSLATNAETRTVQPMHVANTRPPAEPTTVIAGFEPADESGERLLLRARGPTDATVVDQAAPLSAVKQPVDPVAMSVYDAALVHLNAQRYAEASSGFAMFVSRYPSEAYVPNAIYWRGETYLAQGDCVRAMEQFEDVVTRYRAHDKAPDALLKLGICQRKLGNLRLAQGYFDKLHSEYPRSDAAQRVSSIR